MTEILDQNKVAQMGADAGEDMLPMLLQIFVEELEASHAELTGCEHTELAGVAHKVKGSAATFGALALQHVSMQLEYAAKGIEPADTEQLKQQCLETMTQTLSVYRTEFAL
ncbi:Hpt domain-containing protein [uncultured Ferrimonas sp.]|uniref:Hpt domain-containing protein n=1 Tax=uncultured Ferrimonas sp. TaxID=432640 RepID=UPI002610CCD6|nr:Hpt domain-containing protein [uncultured Ferrimonas sp.]